MPAGERPARCSAAWAGGGDVAAGRSLRTSLCSAHSSTSPDTLICPTTSALWSKACAPHPAPLAPHARLDVTAASPLRRQEQSPGRAHRPAGRAGVSKQGLRVSLRNRYLIHGATRANHSRCRWLLWRSTHTLTTCHLRTARRRASAPKASIGEQRRGRPAARAVMAVNALRAIRRRKSLNKASIDERGWERRRRPAVARAVTGVEVPWTARRRESPNQASIGERLRRLPAARAVRRSH
jgi:hypothetical protein